MKAQESDDGHAATAAAASAQHVQGQFGDAEQVGQESGKQNKQEEGQPLTKGQQQRARRKAEGKTRQTKYELSKNKPPR